jgi:hypothetical protein
MRWFYRWYGASPLHLLTLIGSFALAGYVTNRLLQHNAVAILEWLVGAVIGHDLILMPLYTVADRSVMAVFRRRPPNLPTVPWINYLRVPVVLSGLLLLIWFPLILRLTPRYTALTTLPNDPYLSHWLAVTGALFLLSAVALAVRLGRARGTRTVEPAQVRPQPTRQAPIAPRAAAADPRGPYGNGLWEPANRPGAQGAGTAPARGPYGNRAPYGNGWQEPANRPGAQGPNNAPARDPYGNGWQEPGSPPSRNAWAADQQDPAPRRVPRHRRDQLPGHG